MTEAEQLRLALLALEGTALVVLDYLQGGRLTARLLAWATWPVWKLMKWRL